MPSVRVTNIGLGCAPIDQAVVQDAITLARVGFPELHGAQEDWGHWGDRTGDLFCTVSARHDTVGLGTLFVNVGDGQAEWLTTDQGAIRLTGFVHLPKRDFIVEVMQTWLAALVEAHGLNAPISEVELHRAIEVLIGALYRQVLQNADLLRLIDERELFVDQLTGEVDALQAELARRQKNPDRVRAFARGVMAILLSAAASYGGAAAAQVTLQQPPSSVQRVVLDASPGLEAQIQQVIDLCGPAEG
jgi:hypothetical protein